MLINRVRLPLTYSRVEAYLTIRGQEYLKSLETQVSATEGASHDHEVRQLFAPGSGMDENHLHGDETPTERSQLGTAGGKQAVAPARKR